MKIIKSPKKIFFSDKIKILNAIKKKNKRLSNSIKTNIINEQLGNNVIDKKKFLTYASINSKKISKNSIFFGIKEKILMVINLQVKQ